MSDIDGVVSTDQQATVVLSPGTHQVTFRAMDGYGTWGEYAGDGENASGVITVNGIPPEVSIGANTTSLYSPGWAIVLEGFATDYSGIADTYWELTGTRNNGNSSEYSRTFEESEVETVIADFASGATHTLVFWASDVHGLWNSSAPHDLRINALPVMTGYGISSSIVAGSENLTASVTIVDAEGPVASIEWLSDMDGSIGSGESFTGNLSTGIHNLTVRVTDSDGVVVTFDVSNVTDQYAGRGNCNGS